MEALIQAKNISKSFSGIPALRNISIDFYPGRVHVLLGENGAGKSTLIKIMSGVYQKDEGQIYLAGEELNLHNPRDGIDKGISVIHQELSVVADLSVAENIFLDNLPKTGGVLIDYKTLYQETARLMDGLKITNIHPRDIVRNLSAADRQMVEIMRAVSRKAKVVIMDEPTSSLSEREIEALFSVVERLKKQDVAVIYISHKLNEIIEIGDDISIFKDGELVCTDLVANLTEAQMVKLMVGRDIGEYHIRAPKPKAMVPLLEVKDLCGDGFSNISFTLHKGEVLGFSGLIGAGRTEVMRAIFGADRFTSGEILLNGKAVRFKHPQQAIAAGIGLVPEDRRRQGVILDDSVRHNISIVSLRDYAKRGQIDFGWERDTATAYIEKLLIKTPHDKAHIRNLSGGNQQKTVLAKWLAAQVEILILDEPTRGIDVNAKGEIYRLICDYVSNGGSVILISSELPEVIGVSQRIVVMHNGYITGVVEGDDMTEETVMKYATRTISEV